MAEHDHEPTEDVAVAPSADVPCMAFGQDGIHEWGCVLPLGHDGDHSGVDGAFTWPVDARP